LYREPNDDLGEDIADLIDEYVLLFDIPHER
jgi:hypothetical protein